MDAAWSNYFVALAGATAALTGLLFVAVSINLKEILSLPGLTERALESLLFLLTTLIVALLGLVPEQSPAAFGVELIVLGGLLAGAIVALRGPSRDLGDEEPAISRVMRVVFPVLACAPLLAGGVLLILEAGNGLHWVLASSIAAILAAVSNAWVLLVEILR